jgi:hypothetical protein
MGENLEGADRLGDLHWENNIVTCRVGTRDDNNRL